MGVKNRGIFFSVDALIAIGIVIVLLLIAFPAIQQERQQTEIHYDVLGVLSALKIEEVSASLPPDVVSESDPNNTLLEQIGEFYITNQTLAQSLAQTTLASIETEENVGLWFGNTLIWSNNRSAYDPSGNEFIDTARQTLSGIQNGTNVTGFSARAFLSSATRDTYAYLGGYVGDGNISSYIEYDGNITAAEIELVISNDFDLYINGNNTGTYLGSINEFTPVNYSIPTDDFISGGNTIEFKGDDLHIAGGFIKVSYETEEPFEQATRYYFPGIEGLINLYDGLFIPGNVTSMDISLHMNTSLVSGFLNIGNVTVFNGTTNDEEVITINDSTLSSMLDYGEVSQQTTPVRLGLENTSLTIITQNVDVFSVTDLSPSMLCSETGGGCSDNPGACSACGGNWEEPLNNSRDANHLMIEVVLNTTGNQVGLAGYGGVVLEENYHSLTNDNESLHTVVDGWATVGGTGICRGINRAIRGYVGPVNLPVQGNMSFYYKANEPLGPTAPDSSSHGNNASLNGTVTRVGGVEGGGYHFNGIDQFLEIPSHYSIDIPLGSSDFTFSTWYKSNQIGGVNNVPKQVLYSKDDGFGGDNWGLSIGVLNFPGVFENSLWITGGGTWIPDTGVDLFDQNWHHIAVVNNETNATVYVDGVPVAVRSGRLGPFLMEDTIGYVGAEHSNPIIKDVVNGTMDDVRFYMYALKDQRIQELADTSGSCGNKQVETGETCDGDFEFCESGGYVGKKSCRVDCSTYETTCNILSDCGDGFLGPGESCDDNNTISNDGCSSSCQLENRARSMIVMSDGQANIECVEQGTGDADDDAIQSACDAFNNYGINVHAIAFGNDADETTLQQVAQCGEGEYYFSAIEDLVDVYQNLTATIITDYVGQTINVTGNLSTRLFPDSYIEFNYTQLPLPTGLVLTLEKQFEDNFGGTFLVPSDAVMLETRATSYSGPLWTDNVTINDKSVYDLATYGSNYLPLGDPYIVNIPIEEVNLGIENNVSITTGTVPGNSSAGSVFNKVIYTFARNVSVFSPISISASGCLWGIQFEDDTNITVAIPDTYLGSDNCYYGTDTYFDGVLGAPIIGPQIDNPDDAFQQATLSLLEAIDLDGNEKIDVPLTEQNLQIELTEVNGIPFAYSTEVQVRVWR